MCILGKFIQDHNIAGSSQLKNELKRLSASMSFLETCLPVDTPIRKIYFKHDSPILNYFADFLSDIPLGVQAAKSALKKFMVEYTILWRTYLKDADMTPY